MEHSPETPTEEDYSMPMAMFSLSLICAGILIMFLGIVFGQIWSTTGFLVAYGGTLLILFVPKEKSFDQGLQEQDTERAQSDS